MHSLTPPSWPKTSSVDVHAGGLDDLGPELRIGLDAGLGVDTPGPVDQDVLRAEFFLKARRRRACCVSHSRRAATESGMLAGAARM
jgi:hypothetical protein